MSGEAAGTAAAPEGAAPLWPGQERGAPPPLVSIVVRTRNRPAGLREALGSLAAQSYPHVEAVVVNDGGASVRAIVEDALGEAAGGAGALAWTLIEWPDTRRRERAANAGLAAARGEYLGLLDDDDVLYPQHLSVLMAHFARHPGDRVAYTDAFQADQVPDPVAASGYRTVARRLALSWDVDPEQFRQRNWIPLHCVLLHRSCLAVVGGFDEELRRLEDWDFLLRLSWAFPLRHLRAVTAEYRYRTDHPRIADPQGFAAAPEHGEARARIQAKEPGRDTWAPLLPGAVQPCGLPPEGASRAMAPPVGSGAAAPRQAPRMGRLRTWWQRLRGV